MQDKVKEFNKDLKKHHKKSISIEHRVLDIHSEIGELAKEVLKSTSYGTKNFIITNDFKMEFGDVLYALLSLANETNLDAEKCLEASIKKMKNRLQFSSNAGSNNEQ